MKSLNPLLWWSHYSLYYEVTNSLLFRHYPFYYVISNPFYYDVTTPSTMTSLTPSTMTSLPLLLWRHCPSSLTPSTMTSQGWDGADENANSDSEEGLTQAEIEAFSSTRLLKETQTPCSSSTPASTPTCTPVSTCPPIPVNKLTVSVSKRAPASPSDSSDESSDDEHGDHPAKAM